MLFTTMKQASSLTTVFIEPSQTELCNISLGIDSLCDSIGITLELAYDQQISDLQLILLYDSNIDHYLLEAELSIDKQSIYYNYSYLEIQIDNIGSFSIDDEFGVHQYSEYTLTNYSQYTFNTLTIKPWLCSDNTLDTSILPEKYQCINDDQYVKIYLKISALALNINYALTIQNIIFDGSENIYFLNNMNQLELDPYYYEVTSNSFPNLTTCLYNRMRCCSQYTTSDGSSFEYPDIKCIRPDILYSSMIRTFKDDIGLINLSFSYDFKAYKYYITNSKIQNF